MSENVKKILQMFFLSSPPLSLSLGPIYFFFRGGGAPPPESAPGTPDLCFKIGIGRRHLKSRDQYRGKIFV